LRETRSSFPLAWTLVHLSTAKALYELSHEDLIGADAEVLVLFKGIDEIFSQTVHARSSYKAEEIIWNAKFSDIYNRSASNQLLTVDVRRLHNIERV
jgi:inward rectifier potassium channel